MNVDDVFLILYHHWAMDTAIFQMAANDFKFPFSYWRRGSGGVEDLCGAGTSKFSVGVQLLFLGPSNRRCY
jgi:hypothetical protein